MIKQAISKFIRLCLLPLFISTLAGCGGGGGGVKEFYIAQNGNGSNPGSIEQPFATINQAKEAIRSLRKTSGLPPGGVVVWLRDGIYEISSAIEFSSEDSGEDDKPIVYGSYPGEMAQLVGGRVLDPSWFAKTDELSPIWPRLDPVAHGKIFEVNLQTHGIMDYGQLQIRGMYTNAVAAMEFFVNGEPMSLARWPDKTSGKASFANIGTRLSDTAFMYVDDRPSRWNLSDEIWLHGFWKYNWADWHIPVEHIDVASRTITVADHHGYGIASGQPYYAENILEEITVPGEYYIDRVKGILYFWPPDITLKGKMFVSMVNTSLIHFKDTQNITFKDLTVEGGRGTLFDIEGGANNKIVGCTLRNAGNRAATVSGRDNGVDRCEIYNIGDGGIELSGGARSSLTSSKNYVKNSHIWNYGRWSWTYTPAIYLYGVGNIVSHNHIHDAPHSAIMFKGNEHLIEFNDIHDVLQYTSDAGAIYSGRDWGFRGNVIQFNFIHHIASMFRGDAVRGIYLDDCVSGIRITGNVFYKITGRAMNLAGGRDIEVQNNIIARCDVALLADNRGISKANNISGNAFNFLEKLTYDGIKYQDEPWASAYPDLAAIPNDWSIISDPSALWRYPQGSVFSKNIGWNNGAFMVEKDYDGSGVFNKYKSISDNLDNQDPLFEDEENLKLKLNSGSPAFTIPGFTPIPFDQIGIEHLP